MPRKLEITGLSKWFGDLEALRNIDIAVEQGEFISVVGPSGCGKTTFLRMVAGLSTEEIARAFLVPPATVGQRISRAKRTLAEARVPFELPREAELPSRLEAVLEVVYLIFSEGYSADVTGGELSREAVRLGRLLFA